MEKRSRLLTFIFSFMPGAGEMYLGSMKKGLVLLTIFCAIGSLSFIIYIEGPLAFLPVVWCYSFFDTMNLKRITMEERKQDEEAFMVGVSKIITFNFKGLFERRRSIVGYGIMAIGGFMVFDRLVLPVVEEFCEYFNMVYPYRILHNMPGVLVAVMLIIFGINIVKQKDSVIPEDVFVEYVGENSTKEIIKEENTEKTTEEGLEINTIGSIDQQ